MIDLKCTAKTGDGKEIEGYLFKLGTRAFILPPNDQMFAINDTNIVIWTAVEVDPETVKRCAGKNKKGKFIPPTLEELRTYIEAKGYTVNAEDFLEWYTESGWKDYRGRSVKNWKLKVISWNNREKQILYPIIGKICSEKGCLLPAVYKDSSGDYDHFSCKKHLPEEVKKLYG